MQSSGGETVNEVKNLPTFKRRNVPTFQRSNLQTFKRSIYRRPFIVRRLGEGPVQTVKELVEQLPPDIQQEVKDFAEFLLEKRRQQAKGKPNFGWAGALKDLRDDYTSVELQHEIAERRVRQP